MTLAIANTSFLQADRKIIKPHQKPYKGSVCFPEPRQEV